MKLLAVILLLLLTGCSSYVKPPVVPPTWPGRWEADCLPAAVAMCERLRAEGIEANVLGFRPLRAETGHAVTVFFWPKGANRLNAWDRDHGSLQILAYRTNAEGMARAWLKATGRHPATEWAALYDERWRN